MLFPWTEVYHFLFCCSVAQSLFVIPMDCSTQSFSVLSYLPEFAQNSRPLNLWCHPTIWSSLVLFSSHLQSFLASGSFLSQLFSSGGQSIGASLLPVCTRDWFPLGLTGLISLLSKGLSSLLQHHNSKSSILQCSAFFMVQLSHQFMTTGKTIALTRQTFVDRVMSAF